MSTPPSGPLFIFSPNARCGITLLQRLINSTRQIIVYGENAFLTVALPAHLVEMAGQGPALADARRRLLGGQYDFWSSSIWPPVARWQQGVVEAVGHLLSVYQRSAADDGYPRWGIKNPIPDGRYLQIFHEIRPDARFIFIYRHIADILRSQKARKWITDLRKLAVEAARWVQVTGYMQDAASSERVMMIRYEQMVADPDAHADRLEAFAGVEGIDRSVFDRKVNTFVGDQKNGHSPDEYIPPEELTDAELEVTHQVAGAMLKRLEYPGVTDWLAARQESQRLKLATPA
jgi:hypothetical protein